jgi:uncharacterized coiled-coil protein SlyX
MEPRLVDLEVRYTHLERDVSELSQVVFEQQRTIDQLKKELAETRREVFAVGQPIRNEPPPHY